MTGGVAAGDPREKWREGSAMHSSSSSSSSPSSAIDWCCLANFMTLSHLSRIMLMNQLFVRACVCVCQDISTRVPLCVCVWLATINRTKFAYPTSAILRPFLRLSGLCGAAADYCELVRPRPHTLLRPLTHTNTPCMLALWEPLQAALAQISQSAAAYENNNNNNGNEISGQSPEEYYPIRGVVVDFPREEVA